MDWITLLTKYVELNKEASLDGLYDKCKNKLEDGVTKDDFREALICYLKKKVKKFEINGDSLTISEYTKADIPQLFRYFKLGGFVKTEAKSTTIQISILYASWKYKDVKTLQEFKKELQSFVYNSLGKNKYFEYKDVLTVKR